MKRAKPRKNGAVSYCHHPRGPIQRQTTEQTTSLLGENPMAAFFNQAISNAVVSLVQQQQQQAALPYWAAAAAQSAATPTSYSVAGPTATPRRSSVSRFSPYPQPLTAALGSPVATAVQQPQQASAAAAFNAAAVATAAANLMAPLTDANANALQAWQHQAVAAAALANLGDQQQQQQPLAYDLGMFSGPQYSAGATKYTNNK